MDQAYWLKRKSDSIKLAQDAASSGARLAHYQIATRYDVKAQLAEAHTIYLARVLPPAIHASPVDGDVVGTNDV